MPASGHRGCAARGARCRGTGTARGCRNTFQMAINYQSQNLHQGFKKKRSVETMWSPWGGAKRQGKLKLMGYVLWWEAREGPGDTRWLQRDTQVRPVPAFGSWKGYGAPSQIFSRQRDADTILSMVRPSQPAVELQSGDVKSWTSHEILLCCCEAMAGDGNTEGGRLAGKVPVLHYALTPKLAECRKQSPRIWQSKSRFSRKRPAWKLAIFSNTNHKPLTDF